MCSLHTLIFLKQMIMFNLKLVNLVSKFNFLLMFSFPKPCNEGGFENQPLPYTPLPQGSRDAKNHKGKTIWRSFLSLRLIFGRSAFINSSIKEKSFHIQNYNPRIIWVITPTNVEWESVELENKLKLSYLFLLISSHLCDVLIVGTSLSNLG